MWLAFTYDLVDFSDEQGVLYLHGTLGEGESKQGTKVEMASGDDLRGANKNNIRSR